MEQLSLFPAMDEVRFAMSFTPTEFGKLRVSIPKPAFDRINYLRQTVHRWNSETDMADRRYRSALYEVGIDW
jgi:hypothetical protein